MLIYTSTITERLKYVADFAGRQLTGQPIELTTDKTYYEAYPDARVNYSDTPINLLEFWIKPHGLLFSLGITPTPIECFQNNGQKAFFRSDGDLPFDIFAASFFLLSRYEEYLPHQKDMYGRFAFENSVAAREGFLDRPLVEIWLADFRSALKAKFPQQVFKENVFTFLPTYDIDIAWSYRHKGWWRSAGGLLKSLVTGNFSAFSDRVAVLNGRRKDPFDTFGWLHRLHEQYRLKPYYFFPVASRTGRYDKNISPRMPALRALIGDHLIRYPIGAHPSWRSGDEQGLLKQEINTLQDIAGHTITSSRQHYIRFTLPDTYRRLITAGILFDFSMGYGSCNGFRASLSSPFYWYDLEAERQTELMLFPFCYMDANSFYEQKFTAEQALEEMKHYYREVKAVNGTLVTIWHNHFLGTDKLYAGWKDAYNEFIRGIAASQ